MDMAIIFLTLYLTLNCSVTVSNKVVLQTEHPYLLTASHATATFVACHLTSRGRKRTRLVASKHLKLLAFSLLYTINIGISNASLGLVTLPVHQAIRASAPVLTILLEKVLPTTTSKGYGFGTYCTLLPVISGIVLATYGGRYEATLYGLYLTMLGAVLAVVKTITTNILLRDHELRMEPVELLRILSPWAAAQALLWSLYAGEVSLQSLASIKDFRLSVMFAMNAVLAALLNFASFEANKRCGPLTMAITANLKQVILLAVPLNGKMPSMQVAAGTFMTVGGSIFYVYARTKDEQQTQSSGESILPHHLVEEALK